MGSVESGGKKNKTNFTGFHSTFFLSYSHISQKNNTKLKKNKKSAVLLKDDNMIAGPSSISSSEPF